MRRLAALICLCLLLAGCGADRSWRFAAGTRYLSDDFIAGDSGKLIAWYELELPRLDLVSDREPPAAQAAVRDAFNAEMDAVCERLLAEYAAMRSDAVYGYAASGEEDWNRPVLLELSVTDSRCTARLYSALATGSADYSGAHVLRFARAWSYDLAQGRFVQWYDLAKDADALRLALAEAVVAQAEDAPYYDGWEQTAQSLDGCAVYLGTEGFTLVYPQDTLGGHAAGLPTFTVPYGAVEKQLSAYGRALVAE
ncbi:MAG: DUF3298 domain-containing protein [Oscillospiraceae bacterium]|nr:DUF3298 domain-containing protein [Oscillospiraceae bacterium]